MSLAEPSTGWCLVRECVQPNDPAASRSADVVEATGSANADLMTAVRDATWPAYTATLAHAGNAPLVGTRVLVTQRQAAGRSRQSRPWDGDHGPAFSITCAFAGEPVQLGGPSLAMDVVVIEAMAGYAEARGGSGQALSLKWPNSMQAVGYKLAGTPAETVRTAPGRAWIAIDIGLNLERPHVLETALGRGLSGVRELVDAPEADAVFSALLTSLSERLQRFGLRGLAPFAASSAARDTLVGERVCLQQDDSVVFKDVAHGIDAQGHLAVESGGRMQQIRSSEVPLHSADVEQP